MLREPGPTLKLGMDPELRRPLVAVVPNPSLAATSCTFISGSGIRPRSQLTFQDLAIPDSKLPSRAPPAHFPCPQGVYGALDLGGEFGAGCPRSLPDPPGCARFHQGPGQLKVVKIAGHPSRVEHVVTKGATMTLAK